VKNETPQSILDGKKFALDKIQESDFYYSKDLGAWHLISLDSISPNNEGKWYTGKIDEAQMHWLKNELASISPFKPVLIVSHIPILAACIFFDGNRFENNQWNVPGRWMHEDANDLKDLFLKHPNVKIAISGHIHLLDRVEYNGVTYCCNGAVSGACGAVTTNKQNQAMPSLIYTTMAVLLKPTLLMFKSWTFLLRAAGFEAASTYSLKKVSLNSLKYAISEYSLFSIPAGREMAYLLIYLGLGGANIYFLSLSLKSIPLTLAIASWTAISLVFIKLFDVFVLKTPTNSFEVFFLTLIIIGIVGLKFSSPS